VRRGGSLAAPLSQERWSDVGKGRTGRQAPTLPLPLDAGPKTPVSERKQDAGVPLPDTKLTEQHSTEQLGSKPGPAAATTPTWRPGTRACRRNRGSDHPGKTDYHLSTAEKLSEERQSGVPPLQYAGTVAKEKITVLVDTGCNGVFVSKALVKRAELVTYQKPSAHTVRLADGSVVSSGTTARVPMRIQGVCETITAHVLDLAEHDLILGIPWQARHDVIIRPKHGTVRFRFKRARRAEEVVWVPDVHAEMNAQLKGALIISTMQLGKLWKKQTRLQLHQRTTQFYLCTIKKEGGEPETQDTDPNPQWEEKVRTLVSKFPDVVPTSTDHKPPFPPKREIEHEIDLVPGAKPVSRPMYRLSLPEEKLLSENIADLLERGYIEPSVSPFGAPVIFVKKPGDTKLRMCMDYRALNALTVKNATPMPDAEQLMDRLHGAEYYSKIDLASGYHQALRGVHPVFGV
jgi:hypothetical protein